MSPYALAGAVVLALGATAFIGADSYRHGHKNGVNEVQIQWDSARAAQIAEAQKAVDAVQARLTQASADLEKARNEKEIVYRTITKTVDRIVTRDVYRNTCLDIDGVRAINAALTGTAADPAANPAEPAAAVPTAGAAGGDDRR